MYLSNINGNISNINTGELRSRDIKETIFTFVFLKNSISLKMFKIITRLNITKNTNIKDFKKELSINL